MARTRIVGVDIGTSMVRAAEVERQGRSGKLSLLAYAELALPPGCVEDAEVISPASVSATLKQLWRESKFSTKDVVIGVGSSRTAVREIDMPMMPMAQMRQSLPFQVQDMLPMPVDEAILDFVPGTQYAGSAGTMVRGLLVAAAKNGVSANVDAVEAAGLKAQGVDLNALAVLRSAKAHERTDRVVATVDIGASMTTVSISSHGVPRMARVIPSGGAEVTTAIARQMKIQPTDAEMVKRQIGAGGPVPPEWAVAVEAIGEVNRNLVESIRNTFVYHHANNPGTGIDYVVLTGGGALLPGLAQLLSNTARLSVAFGDPLEGVRVEGKAQRRITAPVTMAVAMGLAQAVAA